MMTTTNIDFEKKNIIVQDELQYSMSNAAKIERESKILNTSEDNILEYSTNDIPSAEVSNTEESSPDSTHSSKPMKTY